MTVLKKIRQSFVGPLAGIAAIALILLMASACASKKDANKAESVGSSVKLVELRQVILTQVLDPSRSAALFNLTSAAERELGVINESYLEYNEDFGKMSADHSVNSTELEMSLQKWDSQASVSRGRIVDLLLAMREQATIEEWPAISNAFVNSVSSQSDRYKALRPANS